MFIAFFRFVLGYVRFTVKGDFPERLLNQLVASKVSVWGIRRNKTGISACIKAGDYLNIRQYRAKSKVRTKIVERHGLYFVLRKYKLRVGFATGVGIYVALLVFLSSFVWNIEIVGNEKLSNREILVACERLGLHEGAKISNLDAELLRTRLALELDGIAWASVNFEGVKATVNISESIEQKEQPLYPCNLIATRDGVITGLEVTEGNIVVKQGQTVAVGDLLVSGITEYKDGTSAFGRSSGKVYAQTNRTLSYLATYVQTEKYYTGPAKERRVLTVFGLDIPLYLGSLKGNFETVTTIKRYDSNSMYIPITLTETSFFPVDTRAFQIDEEQAKILAESMLLKLEEQELKSAEILTKDISFEVTEKGVKITGEYKCRENIAGNDLLLIYEEK